MFHHKADGIPATAATKAFVYFFGRRNCEGGGLFIVKRAKSQVISSPSFQFYKGAYHVNNIQAAQYLLYGSLGDHEGHAIYGSGPYDVRYVVNEPLSTY